MNRKLVNGLLLLALASGSCSMFTSCKDTDEDWKNQVILGQVSLEDKIKGLEDAISKIKSCECDVDAVKAAMIAEMDKRKEALEALIAQGDKANKDLIDANIKAIDELAKKVATLEGQYGALQTTIGLVQTAIDGINYNLWSLNSTMTGMAESQKKIAELLEGYKAMMEEQLGNLNTTVTTLQGDVNNIYTALGLLNGKVDGINDKLDGVNSNLDEINKTLGNLDGHLGDIDTTLAGLNVSLGKVETQLTALNGKIATINSNLVALTSKVDDLGNKLDDIAANTLRMAAQIEANEEVLKALQKQYDELKKDFETKLGAVSTRVKALEDYKKDTLEPALQNLNKLDTQINGEGGLVETLNGALASIAENAGNIAKNAEGIQANADNIAFLEGEMDRMKSDIELLQNLTNLYFSSLNERINSLITGIILNQAWNPMFGTINLPTGLSTTIAGNYYGLSDHNLTFPLGSGAYEYNGTESALNPLVEDADAYSNLVNSLKTPEGFVAECLNGNKVEVKSNEFYMSGADNNLGQLYLTINPNNINFEGGKLTLVNSMDVEAPIAVDVKKCNDEVLSFGANLTKAADNNGFYRANLKVAPEAASSLHPRIESGLKSAMKDALLDRTKSDFVSLAKVTMNQLSNVLPAYALKAEWEAPVVEKDANGNPTSVMKTFATYSKYDIAATAFHPLGYSFLYDVDLTEHKVKLPTYNGSFEELINNFLDEFIDGIKHDLTIDFGTIEGLNPDDFKIDLGFNLELEGIKLEFNEPMTIDVTIDLNGTTLTTQQTVDGETKNVDILIGGKQGTPEYSDKNIIHTQLTYTPDGQVGAKELNPFIDQLVGVVQGSLDDFIGQIKEKINGQFAEINDQINQQLTQKLVSKVNGMIGEINDQLANVNGQIQNAVDKVLKDIKNRLNGKLGKLDDLVGKYNSLANRINGMLSQPNHYLQVMMAYQDGNGGLHHLSTNKNIPSSFKFAGGNAVELYMTSYTAELIAPSFAKYVAVSRVFDLQGNKVPGSQTLARKINQDNEYLNVVLPGNQQQVVVNADNLDAGYIYEVVLSSLDYRGYTSSRLYYFTVVK